MTNRPRCGRLTVNYAQCPVFVRHPADACPRHAAHLAGPYLYEIDAHARRVAELAHLDKAAVLNIIYDGDSKNWLPQHLPGAMLRAMYLTAGLRLGVSLDVVRATLPTKGLLP